jgi:hypothetical protein
VNKFKILALALAAAPAAAMASSDSSLFSESLVGSADAGHGFYWNSANGTSDDSPVSASFSSSFTGMDGEGNTQTMLFNGETTSQSDYGNLHVYTTASLANSYYNSANPLYYDQSTNTLNPEGSPDSLSSLGFAGFTDTLQFGGDLVNGYQAIYIFHIDGTNTGDGALADLAVNVPGQDSQSFFDGTPGYSANDWTTTPFTVDGTDAQSINVQFSDQAVLNTFDLTDGGTYSGTSDFSETLTLAGIELVDANGHPFSGWTVSSASGTEYSQVTSAPGPEAFLPFLGAVPVYLRRRRRQVA